MVRRIAGMLVIVLGLSVLPSAVRAQLMSEKTINVVATENVRVQPTLLRLEVQIQAKGDTAEKAVKALQERRKEALAELKELNADEDSVRWKNTILSRTFTNYTTPVPIAPTPYFAPPTVAPPSDSPSPAPQLAPPPSDSPSPPVPQWAPPSSPYGTSTSYRMPPDSPPATLGPSTYSSAAPSVAVPPTMAPVTSGNGAIQPIPASYFNDNLITATAELRAEWRLTSSDPDAIALAGDSLREKLVAAQIFGTPDANGWNAPVSPYTPGIAPLFFRLRYVGALDAVARKAALAAALAKAKDRGTELSAVARCRLGEISSLAHDVNVDFASLPMSRGAESLSLTNPRTNEVEAVSSTPQLAEFSVSVKVNYLIVHPKP